MSNGVATTKMARFLDHLVKKYHVWVIFPVIATEATYVSYAIVTNQSQQQLFANAVSALIAAFTLFGGIISILIMALFSKDDFGKAADFRAPILLGVAVGILASAITLFGLFGILHTTAVSAGR